MSDETFWMVWSERTHETHVRQGNEAKARSEAERLARLHGGKFYVLQAIGVAELPSIYREIDPIPF